MSGSDSVYQLAQKLMSGEPVREAFEKFREDESGISPEDVFKAMHRLMNEKGDPEKMLPVIDRVINLLHTKLSRYEWKRPEEGTFLFNLMENNKRIVKVLEEHKEALKEGNIADGHWNGFLKTLKTYDLHLAELENILFPELEKLDKSFEGLSMLWAMHDRAGLLLKEAEKIFETEKTGSRDFNETVGKLYFMFFGLVKKQELILFPAAVSGLDEKTMDRMLIESENLETNSSPSYSGTLNEEQLGGIVRSLPFDITFVDEKDEVAYFSEGDRIFPRLASVIGRKVQNCHPPKSLKAVEAILKNFRDDKSSLEEFWIDYRGRKVLIRYIAIRDKKGRYLGTLEMTQDISRIKKLKGEKRL